MSADTRTGSPDPQPSLRFPLADARTVWREVTGALRGRRWTLIGLVVVLFVGAALGVVGPLGLGRIVDVVAEDGDSGTVWVTGVVMAVAIALGAVVTAAGMIVAARLLERVLAELRERMVQRAFALPQSLVERAGSGDLVSRATDDVAQVAEAAPRVLPALTSSLFTILASLGGAAVLDWRYAVALLLIIPIHVVAVRFYLRRAPQIYAAERAMAAERARHVLAALQGLPTVHAYGLTDRMAGRIAVASWGVVRWSVHARIIQNRFFARINVAEWVGMSLLLVVGFLLVGNDLGTIGATTAAMLLFLRLFQPIGMLLLVVDDLQSALASLQRIVGVIALDPDAGRPAPGSDGSDEAVGEPASGPLVALDRVDFDHLPDEPLLRDLDLTIHPGETIGLVGTSGAGKTTVAALVAGVHEAQAGDLRRRPGSSVALVSQEVHVFAGTLRENLSLAAPDADDATVLAALDVVGARGLVDAVPDGLDGVVGPEGHRLTAAQAQHLALARLVLADPDLAVLDEATAEAGSTSAGVLDQATTAALEGRAALVVAHRLSQAAQADRILVMERGRIVEQGAHAELVAAGGHYARLWSAWEARGGD